MTNYVYIATTIDGFIADKEGGLDWLMDIPNPDNLIDKAAIVNGNLTKILSDLQEKGYNDLYIDGGQTIQSFLNNDLIDEMIITHVPILLGEGIPLFGHLSNSIKFKKVSTETLNKYLVKIHYKK